MLSGAVLAHHTPDTTGQLAQAHQGQHGTPATAGDSPATRAYKAANAKMHKDMNIKFSGDADRDFAAGMIPHHQGAIDMAKAVLQYGKDPEVRKLAEDIIAAQEKEITQLRSILARRK
ncbi:MAG: DUF305 domain-containing protein [Rhodospirillales bacterium]|nr:DUF305 domain-containing protein [Rhodospirillales bacterium]